MFTLFSKEEKKHHIRQWLEHFVPWKINTPVENNFYSKLISKTRYQVTVLDNEMTGTLHLAPKEMCTLHRTTTYPSAEVRSKQILKPSFSLVLLIIKAEKCLTFLPILCRWDFCNSVCNFILVFYLRKALQTLQPFQPNCNSSRLSFSPLQWISLGKRKRQRSVSASKPWAALFTSVTDDKLGNFISS